MPHADLAPSLGGIYAPGQMKGCNSCAQGQHIGARVTDDTAVGCTVLALALALQQSAAVRLLQMGQLFTVNCVAYTLLRWDNPAHYPLFVTGSRGLGAGRFFI